MKHRDATATTKTCTRCKTERPIEDFNMHNHATGRRQSWCRQCYRDLQREKRADPEYRARERQVENRAEHERRLELAWYRKRYPRHQETKPWLETNN